MLKYSALQAKKNLMIQVYTARYNINDPDIIRCLTNGEGDEDDMGFFLHDSDEFLPHLFSNFHWRNIDVPTCFAEEASNYSYHVMGAIQIPGLLPFINHPLFQSFTDEITFKYYHGQSTVEFLYLPDCGFNTDLSKEQEYIEFKNTPGSFILATQDGSYNYVKVAIEFYCRLKESGNRICELINGLERSAVA